MQQTIVEIITDIVNLLENDVNPEGKTFLEWAFAEFGKYPILYVGFNNNYPPQSLPNIPDDHYPLLSIFSSDSDIGETKNPTWTISIIFMVNNENRPFDKAGKMAVFTHAGFLQVEAFRQEAEFAILRGHLKTAVDIAGSFAEEEMNHPLYKSYSSVSPQGTRDFSKPAPSEN